MRDWPPTWNKGFVFNNSATEHFNFILFNSDR